MMFKAILAGLVFWGFASFSITSDELLIDQNVFIDHVSAIGNQSEKMGAGEDKKLNAALSAITAIELMEYSDVPDLLISLAMREVTLPRKKKRIIAAFLTAIKNTATVEHVLPRNGNTTAPLTELQTNILKLVNNRDFKEYKLTLVQLANQMLESAKSRSSNLDPKLFPNFNGDFENLKNDFSSRKLVQEKRALENKDPLRQDEVRRAQQYKKFREELLKMAPAISKGAKEIKAGSSSAAEMVYAGTTDFLTDRVAQNILENKHFRVLGREDVAERLLLVLSRYKQQNAVLVGSKGAGKTSIVELLAELVVLSRVAENEVTKFLEGSIILQTSTGRISGLAKTDKPSGQSQAMEEYFRSVAEVQAKVGRRIIIFIDEIHTLTNAQVEAIKPILDSANGGILLIGASTSPELRLAFKHNEAFLRRIEQVPVRELSEEEILFILNNSWLPTLSKRHGDILIDEKTMRLVIKKANLVYPDKGNLDAAFVLLDDILTHLRYKANNHLLRKDIDSSVVYSFIRRVIGLPVDPSQTKELEAYRANLLKILESEVLDNERMIEEVLDLWMDLLKNESSRGIRVAAILGRSGTGKSELATQLAIRALGSKERMFVIEGNDYKDANDIKLSILFGVPGGVGFGQTASGQLIEWITDPSKGKHAGIIVINEADKANELFWVRLMEFFDTGRLVSGDNKVHMARKHLVILTSNRGDKILFPEELESKPQSEIHQRVTSIPEEDLRRVLEEPLTSEDNGHLPDSIVNRLDLVTVSNLVSESTAKQIAQRQIGIIRDRFQDSHGVETVVDQEIVDVFIQAYNPLKRGARPMVRALNRFLGTGIERLLGKPEVFVDGPEKLFIRFSSSEKIEFSYKNHLIEKRAPILSKKYVPASVSCTSYFL